MFTRLIVSFCVGFTMCMILGKFHVPLAIMLAMVAQWLGFNGYALITFLYS
jgi:hypothetical protein